MILDMELGPFTIKFITSHAQFIECHSELAQQYEAPQQSARGKKNEKVG